MYKRQAMLNQLLELQAKTAFERPDLIAINEKISELVKQNHSLTRLQTKGCIDSAIFIERSNRNNQKIEELRREVRQLQGPDEVSRIVDNTKPVSYTHLSTKSASTCSDRWNGLPI